MNAQKSLCKRHYLAVLKGTYRLLILLFGSVCFAFISFHCIRLSALTSIFTIVLAPSESSWKLLYTYPYFQSELHCMAPSQISWCKQQGCSQTLHCHNPCQKLSFAALTHRVHVAWHCNIPGQKLILLCYVQTALIFTVLHCTGPVHIFVIPYIQHRFVKIFSIALCPASKLHRSSMYSIKRFWFSSALYR